MIYCLVRRSDHNPYHQRTVASPPWAVTARCHCLWSREREREREMTVVIGNELPNSRVCQSRAGFRNSTRVTKLKYFVTIQPWFSPAVWVWRRVLGWLRRASLAQWYIRPTAGASRVWRKQHFNKPTVSEASFVHWQWRDCATVHSPLARLSRVSYGNQLSQTKPKTLLFQRAFCLRFVSF